MIGVTPEQVREVVLALADRLSQSEFHTTVPDGQDRELSMLALEWWSKGYHRAIFDMRSMVDTPFEVPDDLSELAE